MTEVRYKATKHSHTLSIKGHAGYAEMGSDIVCSAISVLAQTLVEYLKDSNTEVEAILNPGDVWIWAAGPEAEEAFRMVMTGLKLIEGSYSGYIKIKEVP